MAAIHGRIDSGGEFSPQSRKRRIFAGNMDIDRIKQESAYLEAMGTSSPTTPNGTPLLERLLHLEQHMAVLEQKYSPNGQAADMPLPTSPSSLFSSPATPSSLESRCRPAKSVLLETEAKGTLMERIQKLERRISQHSMDLEKAFSSGRFSSSRFEPRFMESDHLREDSEHTESPSRRPDSWSEVQETGSSQETSAYNDNLEVSPTENLSTEKIGEADLKQPTEDAAVREMHRGLEDNQTTPPPMESADKAAVSERAVGAIASSEAEAVGKRMNDDNVVRVSKPEETTPNETSTDVALTSIPAESVEPKHIDEKNDTGANKEQPLVRPTAEQLQNALNRNEDGAVSRDLIHFHSIDDPSFKVETDFVKEPSSLPHKVMDEKSNEQSKPLSLVPTSLPATQMKKEMRKKQSFKHMRVRIQRFFGHKEASATGEAARPHRLGSS